MEKMKPRNKMVTQERAEEMLRECIEKLTKCIERLEEKKENNEKENS